MSRLRTHADVLAELERMQTRLAGISAQLALGGTIARRDIALIRPGEPYHLHGTVTYRIPTEDSEQVLLLLVIPAGTLLDFHDHDCPERGTVLWGDVEVNGARYAFMQQYRFGSFEAHAFRAWSDSGVLLEFPPNEKPRSAR